MPGELPDLIGQSPPFAAMLRQVSSLAPLDRPLLVLGERGTGKELIAARLHFLSTRWDQPLVKLNCAALAPDLLESELFGHEAGAFTGATRRHQGRFERADHGTLFLDEIAAASSRIQEKLLRVVEYGEFERLGGDRTLSCDVRLIGATNLDLRARAATGAFRADLLDRLAFDVVHLPPLRARGEDIPLLANHFGAAMARELQAEFAGFAPQALAALAGHDWPGNVRELRNVAERSVHRHVTSGRTGPVEQIALDPFDSSYRLTAEPAPGAAPASAAPSAPAAFANHGSAYRRQVEAFERQLLQAALAAHGGHQRTAAAALQLTYDQFRGLLRKFALTGRDRTTTRSPA